MSVNPENLKELRLYELANIIRKDWGPGKVYFGAKPYLDAMGTLDSADDNYGDDSGKYIVNYFLCNANTWKGDVARAVKAELKRRVKS